MSRVVLFGGTAEGREIAEFCEKNRIPVLICVATEYGAKLLPKAECIAVQAGRMEAEAMAELLRKEDCPLVIDATHPYAQIVSRNIQNACGMTNTVYRRVVRPQEDLTDCHVCGTIEEMIAFLREHNGNILLTLGSKLLPVFTKVKDYPRRCAVRLLPSGREEAIRLGFLPERILTGTGPFTEEETIDHLRQFEAKILVTKESGARGGFSEKIRAAKACGALPLVLARPVEEDGVTINEVCRELETML